MKFAEAEFKESATFVESTDEGGHEKHERSHGEVEGGEEDDAINEVEGNNDEEDGEGTKLVYHEDVLIESAVERYRDDDLEDSDPGSEYEDEPNLPQQGSEDDGADENLVEGEDDVSEDDEPLEEDLDDEDIGEEEASEESDAKNDEGKENVVERDGEEGREENPKEVKLFKLKDCGKSHKKSIGQAEKSMKGKPVDKTEPSHSRKGKAKVKSMGMIFFCSSKTKHDCFKYRVLGLPESKKDVVEKIYKGMRLFLYDVDLKLMYGIYKAAGPGGYNIEPKAFKSKFPSQVRYSVLDDCLPLAEEKFKKVIKENYYTKNKFDCKLNSLQVKQLCKLFITSAKKGPRQTKPIRGPKPAKLRPSTQREIPVRKRRPAPRDVPGRPERRRKHARRILSPRSPPIPYAYERASHADSYRRDIYPERDRTYRDRRDPHLGRSHPYRDERVPSPLIERREPLLVSRDSFYRVAREPYLDSHREVRSSYLEPHDPYARDGRDPYLDRPDPYRDGRVVPLPSYQLPGRLDPYVDPYGTVYRREPYREGERAEYRPTNYGGGGESFDRIAPRPLSFASSSAFGVGQQQPLVLPRERPSLYSESLYSLSRDPLARNHHRL